MRLIGIGLALWLAGCQTYTLTLNPPPPTGGGGGPLPAAPTALTAYPVDFSAELERAIAEVPGRLERNSLLVQWRLIEKIANASGQVELESAVTSFTLMVDRIERQGEVSAEGAARLRGLAHCYMP